MSNHSLRILSDASGSFHSRIKNSFEYGTAKKMDYWDYCAQVLKNLKLEFSILEDYSKGASLFGKNYWLTLSKCVFYAFAANLQNLVNMDDGELFRLCSDVWYNAKRIPYPYAVATAISFKSSFFSENIVPVEKALLRINNQKFMKDWQLRQIENGKEVLYFYINEDGQIGRMGDHIPQGWIDESKVLLEIKNNMTRHYDSILYSDRSDLSHFIDEVEMIDEIIKRKNWQF